MKKQQSKATAGRRNFLRGSAAAGAGVALVATAPGAAVALSEDDGAKQSAGGKQGYRLTPHIARYYKTTAQ